MTRRLRITHVLVQPVLMWDDGEELTPGPVAEPVPVPLSQLADLVEGIPVEVAALAARLAGQEAAQKVEALADDASES